MFGTIRRHQTWLWWAIIILMGLGLVIYFNPSSRVSGGGGGQRGAVNYGSINGERVSEGDFAQAWREVQLQYFFRNGGHFPDTAKPSGFEPERETYHWLLLIQKQEQMDIHVSTDTTAQFARQMLAQFHEAGLTSAQAFLKQVLEPHGMDLEDFERFVQHFLGIQELIATVGLGGKLVTPQEAQGLYVRERQELATTAVFFSASNYLAQVTVTPDAVAQFYTNQQAAYRIPDRVQVSYVKFDLTNFLAEANEALDKMTNLDEQIEMAYQKDGTNFLREIKAQTLAEAKVKIRDAKRKDLEVHAAGKKASALASALMETETPRPEDLDALAKTNGLPVHVTAPFDEMDGPQDIAVGPSFVKTAFALSPGSEPFAGPLAGEDAVYVIAFNKKLPSELPTLEQIRDRVAADYKFSHALAEARQAGTAFYQTATNGLAQGKTFSAICMEAKLTPVELPPFSISTRSLPEVEDRGVSLNPRFERGQYGLKQLAFSTPPGKVSHFDPSNEGGIILYVRSRLPIDEGKMKADLPAFINSVRMQRQNEAFQAWFNKEVQRGLRDVPLSQPKSPPALSSRTAKS